MDRLPSVGNGHVAPREAGPGPAGHTQGGADRKAWTRLSTVLLSDTDRISPRSRRATFHRQENQPHSIQPGIRSLAAVQCRCPGPPCARNRAGHR